MTTPYIFIRDLDTAEWRNARLYRLAKPVPYRGYGEDDSSATARTTDMVIVSAITINLGSDIHAETYIFPADNDGNRLTWTELPGSFQGACDFERALRGLLEETGN